MRFRLWSILVLIVLLYGCSDDTKVMGKWSTEGGFIEIVFYGDHKGTFTFDSKNVKNKFPVDLTWKLIDGNKIELYDTDGKLEYSGEIDGGTMLLNDKKFKLKKHFL